MPASARYTIHIPHSGADLATATHHYLSTGHVPVDGVVVHRGVDASFDGPPEPHDLVQAYGQDTPELDSHMKQVGAYVGELANRPTIWVSKENGKSMANWPIRNPMYQPAVRPQA